MPKVCDHTSVAIFVWRDDMLLLIQRAKFPYGFAVPAGHVDGDTSFEEAAKRELKEEVGLEAVELKLLLEARKENPCRREGGTWHLWKLYETKATSELNRSLEETKSARWFTKDEIKQLALRNEQWSRKDMTDEEWKESPGLEPVMLEWFKELKIL
ncbi:MAG: NUDIX hydrolase [Patescibacteria group bacterium]